MASATTATVTFNAGGFMDVWGVDHIANCFQISAFVLCIFEHVATFELEITRMWRRRVSPVMLLFMINRYACLCYAASGLVQLAAWGNVNGNRANNICNITSRIGDISEDIMYLMFAFFAALRTYAIWDKNWTVFACVLLPGLIFPIGAIYSDVVSTYTSHVGSGATGCYKENYFPADGSHSALESYNNFYTVGRCSIILFECITLSLTWAKTIPVVRRLRHHSLSTGSLISHCILYNGTLQFTVVLITTVLNLLGSVSHTAGDTEAFVIILASILLSRFILDLREDPNVAQKVDDDGLLRRVSGVSNIRFAEAQRSEDSGGSAALTA